MIQNGKATKVDGDETHPTCISGMDAFLAMGIIKEMLRLGLEDRAFIEQHTIGFADVEAVLESITMEKIERLTEVDRDVMTKLAVIYGERPTATYLGLGMQRYANGGNTIRWIDALVAISGNVGIPGAGRTSAIYKSDNVLILPRLRFQSVSFINHSSASLQPFATLPSC